MKYRGVIGSSNVGHYFEGFGYVLEGDVGRLYEYSDGSYFVESAEARDERKSFKEEKAKAWKEELLARVRAPKCAYCGEEARYWGEAGSVPICDSCEVE